MLTGDKSVTYNANYQITNSSWNQYTGIYQNNPIFYSAHHFSNPYDVTTSNDLNWGYQQTYYHYINPDFPPGLSKYPPVNNLYNRFWKSYIQSIMSVDSKIIDAEFILTTKDIQQFSFNDEIIVNGQIYYVNKIDNWVANEPTRVELLKK
jgi:hypothetical protein